MDARFDYLTATLDVDPATVGDLFRSKLQADRTDLFRPKHYHFGEVWEAPYGFRATIQHGGHNERICVEATGYSGHILATNLREHFPKHRVTRADACIDWVERGGFQRGAGELRAVSDRYNVHRERIDGDEAEDVGCSYYLGAKPSAKRLRLYEKGMQLWLASMRAGKLTPEAREYIDRLPEGAQLTDVNRIEMQVRPASQEAKERLATMQPIQLFGASRWSSAALSRVLACDVERLTGLGTVRREADHVRQVGVMVAQYHRALSKLAGDLGGFDKLGTFLGAEIAAMAERREQLQRQRRRGSGGG